MPTRNEIVFSKLKREFENEARWVAFKDQFPADLVESLEELGYRVEIDNFIEPPDGSDPHIVRDYKYDEYKDEYKFRTVVYMF